jgi:glycosyltransferase involved in cell wall biosynthesis
MISSIDNQKLNGTPKVSVIMPSYNYARFLPVSIKSVLSQSYSNLELIITDDCSTDESREIVEHWKKLDKRVVPVLHQVNQGLARARNSGLAVCSGEFVALCDADDIWNPGKLEAQMKCFERQPELGLVHSDGAIIDGTGNLTGQRFSALYHGKSQKASGYLFETLCERNFLCVPTVILRREAIDYAGGFEENLRSLEDWVCWAKVSRKYPFHYIDDTLVQYRIHGAGLSSNPKGMAQNRVKAFRFLLDTFSDIPSPLRSKMLYSLGVSLLETGEFREAAAAFLDSARANPMQIRSWLRCCQSLLG